MGANVQSLTNRIVASLRDANNDSWPEDVIQEAILEAEKVITNFRPDATAVDRTFTCVAGIKQDLSSLSAPAALRLLDVKYNISGGVPGRSIRRVAIGDLDAIRPDWRSQTNASAAREFMFDPREPLIFYVNPPVADGTDVQLSHSAIPASYGTVDSNTQTTVNELYEPMIIEWALYRLFGHDTTGSVNESRSQRHLNNFQAQMGVKIEAETIFGPKNLEHKQ